ncbi:Flp family type IVb pilin [Thiomicrospira microaerophila]|uniref:Flp family type IVb pilin n=1 Tax=Thiomicrospira microaerophila TaxID=406020 RepID=UPI00200E3A66|nr:Flp family type IVb pilin [Thiomicrospira microaerophila]UQB43063.1 Flp family type IVb pilin [Thiomicrospira microaerophila]
MINPNKIRKQKGASMIEYALIVAGVVAVAALFFGGTDTGIVGAINDALQGAVDAIRGVDAGGE